ncbi:MAG: hypothetical protein WA708_12920 [Acidobacteriaceae bacterium]
MQSTAELAHVNNTFHFEVRAPMSRVAPLFGAEAERCWAGPHWDPEFLYPRPAKDIQGAVFRVKHGRHISLWTNTIFDLPRGRVQYVSLIDDTVVTTVDVKMNPSAPSHTAVEVTYTRTALQPEANDDVRELARKDSQSGPDWQKSIEACLGLEVK